MSQVYLRSGRRPVWLTGRQAPDAQQRVPSWWCERCGMEVYGKGRLCEVCGKEKEHEKESL